jgi:hypothetical protein
MESKTTTKGTKNEVSMGSLLMTADLLGERSSEATTDFYAAVATALGWTVNPNDPRLLEKDDMGIFITTQTYGKSGLGCSDITCLYPRFRDGVYCEPNTRVSIGIGATKTPDAWAKDITSRLLPDYRRVLDNVKERVKNNAAAIDATNARAAQFAEALGAGGSIYGENKSSYERRVDLKVKHAYGHVLVNDKTARFEVSSCPVDVAEKVLVYLASLLPKE